MNFATGVIRCLLWGEGAPCDIHLHDGAVIQIYPADSTREPDWGGETTAAGPLLFDIQVNGAFGIDLQQDGFGPGDIFSLAEHLADWGVSRWMPTLITSPEESLIARCRVITAALRESPALRAVIPGIHLEGPWISPEEGPRGAHRLDCVRLPDMSFIKLLQAATGGHIRMVTLAPELPGALDAIHELWRMGILVALGHHNADSATVSAAMDAGACMATHLGNGVASRLDRHKNPIIAQLAEDRLAASFIADLEHLPPAALKVFLRAKGPERSILVSDAMHCAGMPSGSYTLQGTPVELLPSGRVCLSGTEFLAGSALMLAQGVVNAQVHGGLTFREAFNAANINPARLLGLTPPAFPPKPGEKATFLLMNGLKRPMVFQGGVLRTSL